MSGLARVLLSFACLICADIIAATFASVLFFHHSFGGWLAFLFYGGTFVFAGWILTLPLILYISPQRTQGGFALSVVATLIGPVFFVVNGRSTRPLFRGEDIAFGALSAALIGLLAARMYIAVFRALLRGRIQSLT